MLYPPNPRVRIEDPGVRMDGLGLPLVGKKPAPKERFDLREARDCCSTNSFDEKPYQSCMATFASSGHGHGYLHLGGVANEISCALSCLVCSSLS